MKKMNLNHNLEHWSHMLNHALLQHVRWITDLVEYFAPIPLYWFRGSNGAQMTFYKKENDSYKEMSYKEKDCFTS